MIVWMGVKTARFVHGCRMVGLVRLLFVKFEMVSEFSLVWFVPCFLTIFIGGHSDIPATRDWHLKRM